MSVESSPSTAEGTPGPSIDFKTFVLSLSSTALIHFGVIPDPETKEPLVNLALARQTVDIIAMLREKTRGNLAAEEEKTLEDLLYRLRMHYVKATEGQSAD